MNITYDQLLLIKEALTDAMLLNRQEADYYKEGKFAEEHEKKIEAYRALMKEMSL